MGNVAKAIGNQRSGRAMLARQRDQWLGVGYFFVAAPALFFTRFENGIALLWVATALLVPRLALIRPQHEDRALEVR